MLFINKYIKLFFIRILFIFSFSTPSFAANDELAANEGTSKGAPPSIGNFALRTSQQPGPLISLGQNIIDANQVLLTLATVSPFPNGGAFDIVNATLNYGFTDYTSLYFNYPLRADTAFNSHRSLRFLDVSLQIEHAFYAAGNNKFQDQATIVGGLTLPTHENSSIDKIDGFGAPSYFLGTTFNRTYVDWYLFASPGAVITTRSDNIKIGSQILYQAGVGHNIFSVKNKAMLFALLEFDGQYTQKNNLGGFIDYDSGGNVISLTPSISFNTNHTMTQIGIGFPVVQNLNGDQDKINYFIAANFTWTIT